jgi:hypothetical protein
MNDREITEFEAMAAENERLRTQVGEETNRAIRAEMSATFWLGEYVKARDRAERMQERLIADLLPI